MWYMQPFFLKTHLAVSLFRSDIAQTKLQHPTAFSSLDYVCGGTVRDKAHPFSEYLVSPEYALQGPFSWCYSPRGTEVVWTWKVTWCASHQSAAVFAGSPIWPHCISMWKFCSLWARLHDKQAGPLWIIQAPVVSQLRWNRPGFARLENRL